MNSLSGRHARILILVVFEHFAYLNSFSLFRLTHLFLDATTLKSIDGIGKAPSLKEAHLRFNSLEKIDEIYQLSQLTYASM